MHNCCGLDAAGRMFYYSGQMFMTFILLSARNIHILFYHTDTETVLDQVFHTEEISIIILIA